MGKRDTVRKTLRLKTELVEELEILAIKENRNFNNMVETILEKALKYPDMILSFK